MQIYVHIDGRTHGAYSIDQLRQYVQAGSFKEDHLACYDGKNWVKVKDVLALAVETKKPKPTQQTSQQKTPKKTKKMRTKKLLLVSLGVIVALLVVGGSVAGLAYYLLDDEGQTVTNKENLFILSPKQIVEVYDGDTFKIDLPSQHPLFGDDLAIRVFGIDTPEMRGTSDEVKALAYKAKNRTQELLSDAKTIELKNPQRGKYFRVAAEVWIDGESLGEKLKSEGLAKEYYGESARPEW
jgi:endonuclease YncB( thermonuclease family)